MGNKRGQVTLFVILGLLILFLIALIIFIIPETETPQETEGRQTEISLFVTGCLEQELEEAVREIGMNAGYIETGQFTMQGHGFEPTYSDYLSFFEGSMNLPYWATVDRTGFQQSHMPPLHKQYEGDDSIESQIERFIEENIDECLGGFSDFEDQGMQVDEISEPVASVEVAEGGVFSELDYTIEVEQADGTTSVSDFESEVPVNLKGVYNLAREITEMEMETAFLEQKLSTLIVAYSRRDSDYLPPMADSAIGHCSDRAMWSTHEVEEDFREMLISNIPYIRIENTATPQWEPDVSGYDENEQEMIEGIYDGLSTSVSDNNYPTITANFEFMNNFPLKLDFGEGGFLEPKVFELDMFFAHYCLFEYDFYYNTRFPVLITLRDDGTALGEDEDYMFQFPLMLILVDNFPRIPFDSTPVEEEIFYSDCAREQRISGDVLVNVTNNAGEPVEDALINFRCGPSYVREEFETEGGEIVENVTSFGEECYIGQTNEEGILKTNLPPCVGGGIISVQHHDHTSFVKFAGDVFEGEEYNYSFEIDELMELEVSAEKYFVEPPVPEGLSVTDTQPDIIEDDDGEVTDCSIERDPRPVDSNENVLIRLEKLDAENGLLQVQPFAFYRPGVDEKISLAPGRYKADILLFRNEQYPGEMTIRRHSQTRVVDGGPFGPDETIRYPDEDIEISSITSGGAKFEFEITNSDLINSDEIRFYMIDQGAPQFVENVGRAADDRKPCSEMNIDKIRPVFE